MREGELAAARRTATGIRGQGFGARDGRVAEGQPRARVKGWVAEGRRARAMAMGWVAEEGSRGVGRGGGGAGRGANTRDPEEGAKRGKKRSDSPNSIFLVSTSFGARVWFPT